MTARAPMPASDGGRRHDAWLIDLDGTLYRTPGVRLAMAIELVFAGPTVLRHLRRFRAEHETVRASPTDAGDDPFTQQLDRAANALGVDRRALAVTVERWMIERPGRYMPWFRRHDLLAEVAAFRDAGGRTAIVSDYPAHKKLVALGIVPLFDLVVANGEAGGPRRLKPDPDGYRRAAIGLGVAAERCLVIGDRPELDGVAARAAGMAFRAVGPAARRAAVEAAR